MLARWVALIGIVLASAGGIYQLTYLPLHCNEQKSAIERSTIEAFRARGTFRGASLARANIESIGRLTKRCPRDLDLLVTLAANYRVVGRHRDAIGLYEVALALDRRPEIYFNLGETELEAGDFDAAIETLALAARFHPSWVDSIPDATIREEVLRRLAR